MKKAFALLTAAAMVLSVSSSSVQTVFAESSVPAELPSFIESIGEITPVGEPQPIEDTALHAFSSDEGLSLEVVDSFPLTEEMIAEAESKFPPAETNEISPMANQPDLYPTAFSADTENYHEPFAADHPVIFTFYIYNTGDASASNVVVEYDVDGVIESGRRATLDTTIQAGYALKVEAQVTCPNAGDYQIHLTVNPDHTISEERYDNNSVTSALYTWVEFADTYDFRAVSLTAQDYPLNALPVNVPVTYQFAVANVGGKSGSVPIQITANGTTIISGSSGTLPAGYAQNYTFEFSLNYSLTFNLGLVVNPSRTVTEWKTDDNEITNSCTSITGWEYFFHGEDAKYVGGDWYLGFHANHLGLDVITPYDYQTGAPTEDVTVYSPTIGEVILAGPYGDAGYTVAIRTYYNPVTGEIPLVTRLLHFQSGSIMVSEGQQVDTDTELGYSGNTGTGSGSGTGGNIAHVHIDINTINTPNGGQLNFGNCIDPELFFPSINFTHDGMTGANSRSTSDYKCYAKSDIPFDVNLYISNKLVLYVGVENYDQWSSQYDCVVLSQFLEDFEISNVEFYNLCKENGLLEIYEPILKEMGY